MVSVPNCFSSPCYNYANFSRRKWEKRIRKIIQKMWHNTNILAQIIAVFLRKAVAEEFHKWKWNLCIALHHNVFVSLYIQYEQKMRNIQSVCRRNGVVDSILTEVKRGAYDYTSDCSKIGRIQSHHSYLV